MHALPALHRLCLNALLSSLDAHFDDAVMDKLEMTGDDRIDTFDELATCALACHGEAGVIRYELGADSSFGKSLSTLTSNEGQGSEKSGVFNRVTFHSLSDAMQQAPVLMRVEQESPLGGQTVAVRRPSSKGLETLWTMFQQRREEINTPDDMVNLMKRYMFCEAMLTLFAAKHGLGPRVHAAVAYFDQGYPCVAYVLERGVDLLTHCASDPPPPLKPLQEALQTFFTTASKHGFLTIDLKCENLLVLDAGSSGSSPRIVAIDFDPRYTVVIEEDKALVKNAMCGLLTISAAQDAAFKDANQTIIREIWPKSVLLPLVNKWVAVQAESAMESELYIQTVKGAWNQDAQFHLLPLLFQIPSENKDELRRTIFKLVQITAAHYSKHLVRYHHGGEPIENEFIKTLSTIALKYIRSNLIELDRDDGGSGTDTEDEEYEDEQDNYGPPSKQPKLV